MKKILQVVSAVLTIIFALSNVVAAEINTAGESKNSDLTQILNRIEHKIDNSKTYYEPKIDQAAETAALKELTEAFGKFETDVYTVSQY